MKNAMKWFIVGTLVIVLAGLTGCGKSESTNTENTKEITVVAATSWEAMFAKAAGVKEVTILAPVEMKHPMEYDFKPSDIKTVQDADVVLYSEYEGFMAKIFESASISDDKKVAIMLENTPGNIKAQVKAIADKLETEVDLASFNSEIDALYASITEGTAKMTADAKKVVVQAYMVPVVQSFGLTVAGVFGPEEVTVAKATEMANAKPALVVDNFHMPAGSEIAKLANVKNVEFHNFPESKSQSIQNLVKANAKALGLLK